MRRAFVVQLSPDTQPRLGRYDGWIEEVDTGRELRFRSTEELLAFLGECFESSGRGPRNPDEKDEERS